MRQDLLRAALALIVLATTAVAANPLKLKNPFEDFGKSASAKRKEAAQAAPHRPPPKTNPAMQITLKQQLEKGLKCRRPIEFEFVDHVVKLVEEGKLSIDTVNIAFAWSRKRNSYRPFVYFEASLTELAKREGVDLIKGTTMTKKKLL